MPRFIRASAYKQGEAPVSADAFWKVLRDWPGVMSWAMEGNPNPPAPLTDTRLKAGHSVDRIPCTRICYFDTSSGAFPATLEETLLYVDEEARFIYYNIEGVGLGGMRNYLATTTIDELGPERCLVTCSSRYDVPEGGPVKEIKEGLEAIYERSVIQGIPRVVQRQRKRA